MKYISGVHALNIDCRLETCGDWHQSAIRWDVINDRLRESEESVFGDYGIEKDKTLAFLDDRPTYNVADHIRACLDLIAEGNFDLAQGMRNDFICTDIYDDEIFDKVTLLRSSADWDKIDAFMGKEYMLKWVRYKEARGMSTETEPAQHLWQDETKRTAHLKVIDAFLDHVAKMSQGPSLILKGGTALRACYGSDRFSDNIDFDGIDGDAEKYIASFCEVNGYHYHVDKDTKVTKRYLISYSEEVQPLKVEVSYRLREISPEEMTVKNGIYTYTIDDLFAMKTIAYQGRDRLRDLSDIVYIFKDHRDEISSSSIEHLILALSYQGLEVFDYLLATQDDELIDKDSLATDVVAMFDALHLADDRDYKDVKPKRG